MSSYAFLSIFVVVDPESSNTCSQILDLTEEVVTTTIIVTGVSQLSELENLCET